MTSPIRVTVEPVDGSRAWKAVIETPAGRYSGGGLTAETATLDAFATWRVDVGRARDRRDERRDRRRWSE